MEKYRVCYDTEHFSGSFGCDSLESAKSYALDTLMEWMSQERSEWKSDTPTDEEKERWDYMIYNCGVSVEEYDERAGEYISAWEPSDLDVDCIGWLLFDEE